MSLASILTSKVTDIASSDIAWRNFLKDFKKSLLATCKTVYIIDYHQSVFKYRLRDYLKETSISGEYTWIIVWINNLETELNFHDLDKLLIPDIGEVSRIRKLFDASRLV